MPPRRNPRAIAALSIAGAAGLVIIGLAPVPSGADTFTVTKEQDTAFGNCEADCSLREAVLAANRRAGADTILVPPGTYRLTLTGTGEDHAATGTSTSSTT